MISSLYKKHSITFFLLNAVTSLFPFIHISTNSGYAF